MIFRPTVIKAEKHPIFVKDICIDWQVYLYYSVSPCTVFFERNSEKKIHLLAQMYIKSNVLLNEISCKL